MTDAQNPEHPERQNTAVYKMDDDTQDVCKKITCPLFCNSYLYFRLEYEAMTLSHKGLSSHMRTDKEKEN